MRVVILSAITDHVRTYHGGEVCDLPDDQAHRWIEAGFAEAATEPEAAALAESPERATLHGARKR
jgi:hypothetical protein